VLQKSANLEGVITLTAGALWIPGQAQHVYFINYLNLFTNHTSNQNELCVFAAVLILVSSLTYSVVYLLSQNPNALEWEANIQNISIAIVVNITLFVSLWMFEQNGLQSRKN
jgi:uncharacterized membrane protein YoaT (DUF817 family)